MNVLRSLLVAVAMYSHIPVPQVEWNKKSMAYAMAFFPIIGVLCGVLLLGWCLLAQLLDFGTGLFAAGALLLPLVLTGGIHMDGFCDVTDALSSWQTMERRLEILKDSHIGAFALIGLSCYMVAAFGLWTEVQPDWQICLFLALGYVLSRVLSGLSIVSLRCARNSGLAATFANHADKRGVKAALLIWLGVTVAALMLLDWLWAVIGLIAAAVCFGYYRWLSYSKFGGITGDLAGWFLQVTELVWLALAVLLDKLT